MKSILKPSNKEREIIRFIRSTLRKTGLKKVIIALSGGIDSSTVLFLLARALHPSNIYPVHLPYKKTHKHIAALVKKTFIPKKNFLNIPINKSVDTLMTQQSVSKTDIFRKGNIMARVRMIALFDLAKKYKALVAGTENKSEYFLGYFTRFGDEASDFEPIRHLYKTEVFELARHLDIPEVVIDQAPTAELWENQTDEKELGFSYEEADKVFYLYFEKKLPFKKIEKAGLKNAQKIISRALGNEYKHKTPYLIP